jgi:hypothetical protein
MRRSYRADLNAIADRDWRIQADAFVQFGARPRERAIVAWLIGDKTRAIDLAGDDAPNLVALDTFFRYHLPKLGWGHPMAVVAWEIQGGMQCEPRRYA